MQVYKEYRNFMINKHREDVKRRLTFTECRKLLAGITSHYCIQTMVGSMSAVMLAHEHILSAHTGNAYIRSE